MTVPVAPKIKVAFLRKAIPALPGEKAAESRKSFVRRTEALLASVWQSWVIEVKLSTKIEGPYLVTGEPELDEREKVAIEVQCAQALEDWESARLVMTRSQQPERAEKARPIGRPKGRKGQRPGDVIKVNGEGFVVIRKVRPGEFEMLQAKAMEFLTKHMLPSGDDPQKDIRDQCKILPEDPDEVRQLRARRWFEWISTVVAITGEQAAEGCQGGFVGYYLEEEDQVIPAYPKLKPLSIKVREVNRVVEDTAKPPSLRMLDEFDSETG